jgi:hypothetical protein
MDTEPIADNVAGTAPEAEPIINEPSQTPLEQEIARETKRSEGRSEAEKAAFSLKKNLERAKELGVDVDEVLGVKTTPTHATTLDKDAPLTVGMYEQMQKESARKSAIELAGTIADQYERDLTISYLKTRIVPSGDAHEDLRFARLAVNSVKNGQIVEEISRQTTAKTFSSKPGAPIKPDAKTPELTPQEQQFTKILSPEEIVKLRTD